MVTRVFAGAGLVVIGCSGAVPTTPQTMQAACHAAAATSDNISGFIIGPPGIAGLFEGSPWSEVGATYIWDSTTREDLGTQPSGGHLLRRYRETADFDIVVDAIPGGLSGRAWCYFIQDSATYEFWWWGGDGTWLRKGDPSVTVTLDYDEYFRF